MKRRGDSDLFSMSFLDVICCGFAAMVLLVLLSKTNVAGGVLTIAQIENLLGMVATVKETKDMHEQQRDDLLAQVRDLKINLAAQEKISEANPKLNELKQHIAEQRATAKILQIKTENSASQNISINVPKVGGIPVDSEHIIFIVDTSGSMKKIWLRVIDELENVLTIHPEVTGFNIMNASGRYLMKSYAGGWIPDTPAKRKLVLLKMKYWSNVSSSSPVKGIERALETYAQDTDKLALYVFGDDYTGASHDAVLDMVAKLNRDTEIGQPLARIHGIGFLQANQVADKFATLMREVARQNRGAFVALGLNQRATIVKSNIVRID